MGLVSVHALSPAWTLEVAVMVRGWHVFRSVGGRTGVILTSHCACGFILHRQGTLHPVGLLKLYLNDLPTVEVNASSLH